MTTRHLIRLASSSLAAVLAGVSAAAPTAVGAQNRDAPSPRELWEAYPLQRGNERNAPTPTGEDARGSVAAKPPTATPAEKRGTARPAEPADDDGPTVLLLAAPAAVAVALGALWVLKRRRGHRASIAAPVPEASSFDKQGRWLAEIVWQDDGSSARFRAIARTPEGDDPTVIAESEALDWPPPTQEAVQDLSRAASQLADELATAGWKPMSPGPSWYSRRFAWVPDPPPDMESRAHPARRRFERRTGSEESPTSDAGASGQPSRRPS